MSEVIENKVCKKCGTNHPLTDEYFYWDSTNQRYESYCKVCKKSKSTNWRESNPWRNKAYQIKYYYTKRKIK